MVTLFFSLTEGNHTQSLHPADMSHDHQQQLCRGSRGRQSSGFPAARDQPRSQSEETSSLLSEHLISDTTPITASQNFLQRGHPVMEKKCRLRARPSTVRSFAQRTSLNSNGVTVAAVSTAAVGSPFATPQVYHKKRAAPRDLNGNVTSNGNECLSFGYESFGFSPDDVDGSTTSTTPSTVAPSRKKYERPEIFVTDASSAAQMANHRHGAGVYTDSLSTKGQLTTASIVTTQESKTSTVSGVSILSNLLVQPPLCRSRPQGASSGSFGSRETIGMALSTSQTRSANFTIAIPAPSGESLLSACSSYAAPHRRSGASPPARGNEPPDRLYPSSTPAAPPIYPPCLSPQSRNNTPTSTITPITKTMSSGDGSNGALAPFKLSSWHCISAAPATRTTPSVDVAKGAPELAAATARGPAPTSVASVIDIRNGPTPPNGFLPLLNVPHMQSRTAMPPIAKNDSVASIVAVSDEASSSSRAPCHQPRPPPPRHPGPTSIVKGSSSSTSSDRAPSSTAVLAEPLSEMQLHRAPIPLRNFGATCYLNSIVQCLVCTPGFLHALENERRRIASESAEKRCSSRNRAPGDAHERSCADRHAPATSLLIHLGTAHPAHHHPVPQLLLSLKLACAEFNDEFSSNGQNDAHELLITLLGVIDREVCRSKPGSYEAFKDLENEKKSEAYARWVYRLQQENNSAVYDFFGGITGCTIKCESCNLSSYRFEATLDISLPVTYRTRPRGANGTTGLSGKASNNATEAECVATVDELLRDLFLSERGEFLSGPMQVTCDRCKKLRDKTIWSSMEQWPPILVLHLKRFDNAGVKNGAAVVFPYTFSPCRRVKYQLYAVCCHRGTSSFGHYTSYTYVERKDAPAAPRGDPVSSAALSDRTEGSVNSSNRDQRTNVEGCHQSGRIGASGAREGSCRGKGGDGAPGGGNRGHNETNIVNGRDRAISAGNTTRTGKWYLCNDQKIMEVTAADVLSMTKEVYILFYRQVDGGFGTTL